MIVVDTSIIGSLYLNSEYTEDAERAFQKDPQWIAPLLWRSEFRNVITQYIRENLISLEDALHIMEEAETLMRGAEYETTSTQVLKLASLTNCSVYDCEFVALARDLNIRFITIDERILNHFPDIALSLHDFINEG